MVQLVFVIICVIVTWFSIKLNKSEQDLKIKYKVNFEEGDVQF